MGVWENSKILVVDDSKDNVELLAKNLRGISDKFKIELSNSGEDALSYLEISQPDLILLDVMMPGMGGQQVLKKIKENKLWSGIPVIMVSATDEMDTIASTIEIGADDYLVKPINSQILKARVISSLERNFQRKMGIYSTQQATIFALAKLAEYCDPETGNHLLRIREYCKVLSEVLSIHPDYSSTIDDDFITNLYYASALHDIGKVGIDERILSKPGKLNDDEYDQMKQHTLIGTDALKAVDREHPGNNFIRFGIQIAESHHEQWGGGGYPHKLEGKKIPLVARIMTLADVYDALTSKRVYKQAYSHEKSKEIILKAKGTHFDPEIVDSFGASGVDKKFRRIRAEFPD